MRLLSIAALMLMSITARAADCLEIGEQRFELNHQDIGTVDVLWQAEIANRCDLAFDALLTLHFMAPDGTSLYWVRVTDMLDVQETKTLSQQLLVPTRVADQFESIDIEVEERERPL
jgi:hypothetical protein